MLKIASFFPFLFLHQLRYESCMVLQPMRLWLMMGRVTLLLHDLYLESCARTQKNVLSQYITNSTDFGSVCHILLIV